MVDDKIGGMRRGGIVISTVAGAIVEAIFVASALVVAELAANYLVFAVFDPSGPGPRAALASIALLSSAFTVGGLGIAFVVRFGFSLYSTRSGRLDFLRDYRAVLYCACVGTGLTASTLVWAEIWYGFVAYGLLVLSVFSSIVFLGRACAMFVSRPSRR